MVQLNNTTKGKIMSLTPQEEALNNQVQNLPVVIQLQETDKILMDGQHEIQEHLNEVDQRLEDGSKVMKGLIEDVKSLSSLFSGHVTRTEQMHTEIKAEIKDNKYQDMKAELKAKNEEIENTRRKVWEVVKMILTGIISLAVGGLGVYLFK